MQVIDGIFYVIVLIMSVVVHEVAHGYTAYLLGDNTARLSGRLTLNPLKHLDFFGSIVLPLFLILSNTGFILGWAKPVPYNPNNLRDEKKGTFLVSLAGVLTNFVIAILFGLLIRFAPYLGIASLSFYKIASIIVQLNLVLGLFNLIPIPPLDGSKILFSFLSTKYRNIEYFLERWSILILIPFIIVFGGAISQVVLGAFRLITGL